MKKVLAMEDMVCLLHLRFRSHPVDLSEVLRSSVKPRPPDIWDILNLLDIQGHPRPLDI
jgi:hypothetical protein